jgi:SAM-dependent methyltransferase
MTAATDSGPRPWFPGQAGGEGDKRHAPATQRNRDAIVDVLARHLPARGLVLEVASGSGEHVLHFARCFPALTWQPSDPDPDALRSIAAWNAEAALPNFLPPVRIDASAGDWAVDQADAMLCINMIHISPWAATLGLLAGAARLLPPGGLLYTYGPYLRDGIETAPSNIAFEGWLKAQNEAFGIRDVEAVAAAAREAGLDLAEIIEMPANNLSLIFRRDPLPG